MKYVKIGKRNKKTMAVTLRSEDMEKVKYASEGAYVYWEVVNGYLTLKPRDIPAPIDAVVVSSQSV